MKQDNTSSPRVPNEVIGALADAFQKSWWTIQRWIETNDDRLTSEKAIKVLDRYGMRMEDLIGATSTAEGK